MIFGMTTLRAALALAAALFVATASVAAPVSELSGEMRDIAAIAGGEASMAVKAVHTAEDGAPRHQHPDASGHTHCGAACHLQLSDARLVLAIDFSAPRAVFGAVDRHYIPAVVPGGLFRPPRA